MAEILHRQVVYQGYSTVERVTARLADGAEQTREVESHGRAVAVLPYDPTRKVALLVRQFRLPVKAQSGADHLLEAPAGMVDPGETTERALRREAFEETGLRLGDLEPVGVAWTSPGVSTETMALYLAPYALADQAGPGGGLESEQENITVVETPLARLAELASEDHAVDMKLLVLAQALRLRRPDLFD